MINRHLYNWLGCTVLLLSSLATVGFAGDQTHPNVILLMSDDQGWGDVGFNGNEDIHTPNLDAMAASGVRLNRFYAAAPLCSPTRGSCLTCLLYTSPSPRD